MCRVLVAHMIKTRILQHCKKIKHVGAKGTNTVFSVLHRFRCCTVADVYFYSCVFCSTPNFSLIILIKNKYYLFGNIALFRLGLGALCIV